MTDTALVFARPWLIAAGLAASVLLVFLWTVFDRKRDRDLAKIFHPRFRQRLLSGVSPGLKRLRRGLFLLGVLALFVAAAGPGKGYEWREVKRRGIDLLFAVDTSRSMLAEDLSPNRLERARMGILDFVSRLQGDRVGLIPFAGSSYALCPLTLDHDAFRESLNALDTDLIPKQGTDIASAIREAGRLFDEQGNNHRILVLVTDGEDLQGDVFDAAEAAGKKGMVIYPVGVGSPEGATIPIRQEGGGTEFVRDAQGNPVRTRLDEAGLRRIAEITGGLYVPLGRAGEGLQTIYQEKLRLVPQNESGARMEKIPLERFEWPLGLALVLLVLEFLLPERRRRQAAVPLRSAARRHSTASPAALLVLAAGLAVPLSASRVSAADAPPEGDPRVLYNQGTREYNDGDFDKAAVTLRSSLNNADLALQNRTYYNLGNTLYRAGQSLLKEKPEETIKSWEEAVAAYESAIALSSSDTDALNNKELVQRKLQALKDQQNQQKPPQDQQDDKKEDKKEDKKDDKQDQDKKDQSKDGKEQDSQEQKNQGKDGKEQDSQEQKDQGKDGKEQDSQDQKDPGKDGKEQDSKEQKDPGKDGKEQDSQDQKDPRKDGKEQDSQEQKDQGKDGKEQDSKDQKDQKDSQDQKDPGKNGKEQDSQNRKDPGQDGKEPKDSPSEKGDQPQNKPGDETPEKGAETKDSQESKAVSSAEERKDKPEGMTPDQAKQLLQSLRKDERTVIPIERPARQRRFLDPNNTTKGKTW